MSLIGFLLVCTFGFGSFSEYVYSSLTLFYKYIVSIKELLYKGEMMFGSNTSEHSGYYEATPYI